jgi:tetratricopeptide (TPR) repeat protein
VRGSIYRRLGAYQKAIEDYEAVVEERRVAGASAADLGQALSELGYGYLFRLRFGRARSLMEEGVRLLTGPNTRTGFLIRAKRKLAIGYYLTGHFASARRTMAEARSLATEHQVHDQQ